MEPYQSRDTPLQLNRKPGQQINPSKKVKTILRTPIITVVYEGKNVTPQPLDPQVYTQGRERHISTVNIGDTTSWARESGLTSDYVRSSIVRFRTDAYSQNVTSTHFGSAGQCLLDPSIEALTDITDGTMELGDTTFSLEDEIPSVGIQKIPENVSLILCETATVILLDLPSSTVPKDTEEGDIVEELNQHYDYLTKGKGRNRKVINVEVQTYPVLKKTRNTHAPMAPCKNSFAYVSNYDMYDTYTAYENNVKLEESAGSDQDEAYDLDDLASVESYKVSQEDKDMNRLIKNNNFLEAVCVMERLLANNRYNEQQKRLYGLSDPEEFREDIEYKYRLQLLWTLANDNTKNRCVTALDWNSENRDLLAVAYGKFFYSETATGMVMIWNSKNPVQPERQYDFVNPATTLSFSKMNPNLLAVGFHNGHVIVLNVVSRVKQIIAENVPSYEAVWDVSWDLNPQQNSDVEYLTACSDDGRVCLYTTKSGSHLECQQIMRVATTDGKLKGYDPLRKCSNLSVPVARYSAARLLRLHPIDKSTYLVATSEGAVHKCSTNYLNQHRDVFLAHDGPINGLAYSPFSSNIYATCGDDWHLRIWAEGISEPIITLFVSMSSIEGMDWSPTHSTILATLQGKFIYLWDFQRKAYEPQSTTTSPTGSRNTVVKFIDSGRCLMVGDITGNVHVFSLEDMPFPAFFQENLLFQSLKKNLITNPKLLSKLQKIRGESNRSASN